MDYDFDKSTTDELSLPLLDETAYKQDKSRHCWSKLAPHIEKFIAFTLTGVLCTVSCVLLLSALGPDDVNWSCSRKMTAPLLDIVGFTDTILDANTQSIYTEPLGQASDQAWNDIWHYGPIGIEDNKLPLLNKTVGVDWARHDGNTPRYAGQVKAYFEGFHRIHCLHLVMVYAFRDSYNVSDQHFFNQDPARMLNHVEHCIDNIRWAIDCTSDITPYLVEKHVDLNGQTRMRLNLRKPAKCRVIGEMQDYASANTVGGLRGIAHES